MIVQFIGAGPGASDLITLRGARAIHDSALVLYAGSLVPDPILEHAAPDATVINTMRLSLDEQTAIYRKALEDGVVQIARVHSGDPAIYGATAEQFRILESMGVDFEVIPGVSSFSASAAAIKAELTRPEVSQTIILTRAPGRASAVSEDLAALAKHRATLCLFLSGHLMPASVKALLEGYDPDTPVCLVQRASQPEQRIHRSTLGSLIGELTLSEWRLTTMMLVGEALNEAPGMVSRLYDAGYAHRFRKVSRT
jgi:precorrin-4/cobalt-precorrin-4 C11-methyltransferase